MTIDKPVISIVVGSYNRKWLLQLCIGSIRENGITVPYEIIIVDGGSTDGTLEWLIEQREIITIVQHNRVVLDSKKTMKRSWGYFMNLGFKSAQGKYICMLSDDCIVRPGAIMSGYRLLEKEEHNKVRACAFYFRDYPREHHYRVGCLQNEKLFVNHGMYRRDVMEEVGWIEEDCYRFYHADTDFCLKIWQQGYQIIDCPDAKVDHYADPYSHACIKNYQDQKEDWAMFQERWTGIFYDPEKTNAETWRRLEGEADDQYAELFAQRKPFEFRNYVYRNLSSAKWLIRRIVSKIGRSVS